MDHELNEVGALLKKRRKERLLTLKEVENSTSIRSNYLEAIEEGRVNEQLSTVYAQGFTKQYGKFLDLDMEQMMLDYPEAFKSSTEKHEFSYGIGTLEKRGSLGGGVKWFPNLLWMGVSAVILFLAWYLARYLGIF
jgi:cytoskeletal protein RodZ